jgi:succinate-semialdehyde dehydrogenase/glutarate-semialdehyde dehydrogenase
MTSNPMKTRRARLWIDGVWTEGQSSYAVFDKYTYQEMGQAEAASKDQVSKAVASAKRSFLTNTLDAYQRYEILYRASQLIAQRREEIADTITCEAGFPSMDANNEVTRAVQTFILSAEEAKRLTGEGVPIEASPGNAHRMAFTIRQPRGVVCGITAFNSPLNMIAHKVAPALASGNTVVIKPPQQAPFSATLLFEILLTAGLPPNHIQLVQGDGAEIGGYLVEDPDIDFYTFTGSTGVGKKIRAGIGLRPSSLELGSIAATIVFDDADLERAAIRVAYSGFRRAGQACTSTQRLFVHEDVATAFVDLLVAATQRLPVGDPHNVETVIGPMISEREAQRAQSWVEQAVSQGARIVLGGNRDGALFFPTILTDVRSDMRVVCEEIFAPVLSIIRFRSCDEVIEQVNSTEFGLAAGVFTRDINRAMLAARRLHVGVVHINEPSSSRVDMMPFAGVKESGLGREGPRYAMQEMTEERLITISLN